MKWVVGMHAAPDSRLVWLYQRAQICRAFPAYKLHEVAALPARDILQAMALMDAVAKAQSA